MCMDTVEAFVRGSPRVSTHQYCNLQLSLHITRHTLQFSGNPLLGSKLGRYCPCESPLWIENSIKRLLAGQLQKHQ